jgi:hypothetical protein
LDILPTFKPLQSVAFLRLLLAFTDPSNIQMHVSWYHSTAKHCIVLPFKFEDGLSVSVLRKKSFFPKLCISIFQILKFLIEFSNFLKPAEKSTIGC